MTTTHRGRTFDYVPRLVEANKQYRVGFVGALGDTTVSRFWTPGGVVLDQGYEGACVGFGVTGEAMASPMRQKWPAVPGNVMARAVYKRAQQLDPWPGEDYEGTSVHAGMLVGREWGWWEGFRWAFSMAELRAALELGPVVIGGEWREGMYEAPGGWLIPTGPVVGGHCILVTGYSATRGYRLRNSWGPSWGRNGSAYISPDNLDSILFQAGGEAAVPIGRKLVAA